MKARGASSVDRILEGADGSLLEIIDHVLGKGVMVNGEVFIGVAGVDLIYLRLSALLCAADKVLPKGAPSSSTELRQGPKRTHSLLAVPRGRAGTRGARRARK